MDYRKVVDKMIKECHLSSYYDKDRKERAIQRLFVMDNLLKAVGGSVRSRQIVALVVAQEIDIDTYIENVMDCY